MYVKEQLMTKTTANKIKSYCYAIFVYNYNCTKLLISQSHIMTKLTTTSI